MISKLKIISLLLMMLLGNCFTAYAQINIEDMDEDDWINQRDTSMLSRKNRTHSKENTRNAMQYIVNDRMTPTHEDFSRDLIDHVYFGASVGMERLVKEDYARELTPLAVVGLSIGKDLTPLHSVRASLLGGFGFVRSKTMKYQRIGGTADYFFNLTNHFNGYSATRPLEVSLNAGAGVGLRKLRTTKNRPYIEGHVGLQFRIYTGPFASMTVEPYFGYTNDGIDYVGNWRGYDMFYGLKASCMFFAEDNLSKASRERLLAHRAKDDRLIDRMSLESWRTPWFVQLSMGGVKSSVLKGSDADGKGNVTTVTVGRWMSSVLGLRGSIGSRISHWHEMEEEYPLTEQTLTKNYNTFLLHGKLEAMINPLGFKNGNSWNEPYGFYLFGGMEVGQMRKYSPYDTQACIYTVGGTAGFNMWYQLSKDLRAFVEPHYSVDFYEMAINHKHGRRHDKTWGVDLGLAMLLRSERYRDPEEFDAVQNFNYSCIRGLSFGIAGGGSILQRRGCDYGHEAFNYSALVYAEYRLNHLHGIRLSGDYMHLSGNIPVGKRYILQSSSKMLVTALDYQINLTNLFSGRFRERTFSLEAYIGPAYGAIVRGAKADNKPNGFFGANFGLKLSVPVYKGLSAILQPNFYSLNKATLPTANPIGAGEKFQIYQNITVGLQFNTNYFINGITERINKQKRVINNNWKEKQKKAIADYQQKQRERIAKRHAQRK